MPVLIDDRDEVLEKKIRLLQGDILFYKNPHRSAHRHHGLVRGIHFQVPGMPRK